MPGQSRKTSTGRWSPSRGARVRVVARTNAPPDEAPPPRGLWYVIDRGPGHQTWWIKPVDLESQAWAATHPGDVTSECWLAPGQQLVPQHGTRI